MSRIAQTSRRSQRGRPALSAQEKAIALTIALAVCAPPWFLGGMTWWQQLIFLGLALIPFILCFLPGGGRSPKGQCLRLLKFPVFWLTLAFLVYIIIGALNYSWEYTLIDFGRQWRMEQVHSTKFIHWLPNGVKTPFYNMSPWRVVILYSTGLLLVCSVWLGLQRRRAVWLVINIIAINAFLVALLVILQQLTDTKLIYWHFESANRNFAGPFQYRNHGAAYLYLGLAASFAATFHYWRRMREEALTSSPAPLFAFTAFVIIAGLLFAGSRGGILFGGLVVAMAGLVFLKTVITNGKQGVIALGMVIVALGLGVYFVWPVIQSSLPELNKRLEQTEKSLKSVNEDGNMADQRITLTWATLDMWEAHKWTGWGAGSFRFIFPKFQQNYRELYYAVWSLHLAERNPAKWKPKRTVFYNSHNDWAQALAEYGIIGCGLLFLCLGFWYLLPLRHLFELSGEVVMLYAGASAVLLHALLDFPLWNPPILFLFVNVLALGARQLTLSSVSASRHD